jgi:hypothetical protein
MEERGEMTTTAVALREPEDEDRSQLALSSADPRKLIAVATAQATALNDIIEKKQLFVMISGKKHVKVEGWQTLGALNQLQAFTDSVEVERLEDGTIRATAYVSARRVTDGVAIARAEGFCSTAEARWKGRDESAVRSMAQTRATSKVFRQALAWVMTLAGYAVTPVAEAGDEGLDQETQNLFDNLRQKVTEDQKKKVADWMKTHKFKTWADFYARGTNEEALEISKMMGHVDAGFDAA